MIRWLSIILLVCFLYEIREVFPPFIVGGIIAYLLLPLVSWLNSRTRLETKWAVLIIYLLFVAAVVLTFWFFGGRTAEQFSGLVSQRKEIVTNLLSQVSTTFNYQMDVNMTADEILSSAEKSFGQPGEIMHLGGLLSKSMLSLLVTVVSSIYFILDSHRVGQFFLRFLPAERRHTAINLFQQMNLVISKYVQGQLILITLMACVAYFILHVVFHLKYALIIAIFSGFLEIIPVLGPFIATTTATIVGISQPQIGIHALWIIPCYVGARWAEDYVIIPRIIGHAVELHPLAVIFAVLCGETMAGALGMLIAIPVAASIKVVLDFCYPPLSKQDIKDEENERVTET
jgi:predicted PurR-regulated permease PerM